MRLVLSVALAIGLSACVSTDEVDSKSPAVAAAPDQSFDGLWEMSIRSKAREHFFSGSNIRLNCRAFESTRFLRVEDGQVRNFLSLDKPAFIASNGKFKFDIQPNGPIYRSDNASGVPQGAAREWIRFQGRLAADGSGTGKHVLASTTYGGKGCTAKIKLTRQDAADARPVKLAQAADAGVESLVVSYAHLDKECKPADYSLYTIENPAHGKLRLVPETGVDLAITGRRVLVAPAKCRNKPIFQRTQIFYTPDSGYQGRDKFTVGMSVGDGFKSRIESFEVQVGE